MAELSKTYVFLGSGIIWDPEDDKVLCRFGPEGKFATNNPKIVSKLMAMRVPFVDNEQLLLQNAEYAIEILTDRVNVLERQNEEYMAELELYRRQAQEIRGGEESKEVLMAELDYHGIPYIVQSTPATLRTLLDEYKTYQRNAAKLRLMEGLDNIS